MLTKSVSTVISSTFNQTYKNYTHSCKLLVVGGGSGGCTIASKFSRRLGKDSVIVIEPSSDHYYQPLFTLVGAGVTPLSDTKKPAISVLPKNALWLEDWADCVDPKNNVVATVKGDKINYEYLVIAVGLNPDYGKIPGLCEALNDKNSGVSTIYSSSYCEKTWTDISRFKEGEAIFTYPDTPIKCPGAPQKILYLADEYLRKKDLRRNCNITYNTSLPVIFGVKKYADALLDVVQKRQINVNYKTVLSEIRHDRREAVFADAADRTKKTTTPYNLLHVSPPMVTPGFLRNCKELTDEAGYLTVDKYTLQHTKYSNIYGIGDCTNTPNSKTAAAIAKQSYVLEHNLLSSMKSGSPSKKYDGYGACPLLTAYGKCILAEFLYDGVVRETFPFDQSKERWVTYQMKKHLFPFVYWNFMLKGYYHGPEFVRKIVNPFSK